MSWKLAPALVTLRNQVNKLYPTRSKASDGTIGDVRHQAKHSDHNPNGAGIVCAWDCTATPHDKWAQPLADHLADDSRTAYVIFNRRITSGVKWYPYRGTDPHTGHIHLSLRQTPSAYDSRHTWALPVFAVAPPKPVPSPTPVPKPKPPTAPPAHVVMPVLKQGAAAPAVRTLQTLLHVTVDGKFGPITAAHVIAFQKAHHLAADAIVGPATWKALGK
jgi:hypothetical protein